MKLTTKYYLYIFFSSLFFFGPVIQLFYLQTVSYEQFGLIIAAALLAMLVLEVPSGVIADHIGRKKAVVSGLLLGAVEILIIAIWQSFPAFLLASFLSGAGYAFASGADHSLIYDSLKHPKKESKKVFGREKATRYIAIVIAAVIGAPIYAVNQELTFYLTSAGFTIAAIAFSTIKENHKPQKTSLQKQWTHMKESFETSWKSKKLRWFIFFGIFSGFSIYLFHDLIRSPVIEGIGYPIASLGIVVAIMASTRAIISYHTERIENFLGRKTTQYILLFAPTPLFILTGFVYNQYALIFLVLLYWVWSLQEVVVRSGSHEHMNKKQRATLSSIQGFYDSIVAGVGFLLFGLIVEATTLPVALFVLGGVSLFSGLLLQGTYYD